MIPRSVCLSACRDGSEAVFWAQKQTVAVPAIGKGVRQVLERHLTQNEYLPIQVPTEVRIAWPFYAARIRCCSRHYTHVSIYTVGLAMEVSDHTVTGGSRSFTSAG